MGAAIARSPEAKRDFESIGMHFGECPHALQQMTQNGNPPSLGAVRHLLVGDCPVQKLTLKRHIKEWTDGGILDVLDRHGRYE